MNMHKMPVVFLIVLTYIALSTYASDSTCSIETRINCSSHCTNNKCSDDDNFFNKTFFAIRPQDSNSARRIMEGRTNSELFYEDHCAKISLALEWQQSFNKSKLAKWFSFNCSDCMSIGIPGDDQTFDIDGRQFGLTTAGLLPGPIGSFCLEPHSKNFIADLDIQVNLNDYLCGLWTRMIVPLVFAKTNLGLRIRNDQSANGSAFPAGLFSDDCSTTSPKTSILSALQGDNCGKFSKNSLSKWGIAGIHFDIGYDVIRNDDMNLGASLHIVAPTGTQPKARYLFEPVIGANRCFQLGANVNASYNLYDSCLNDKNATIVFDATLTHLFKSTQRRLFALKNNGAGSQYLLLKQFNAIGTAVVGTESAANLLCAKTRIGSDFMFDGAVMLHVDSCNFFGNIGYNLWFRSKEKKARTMYLNNFGVNSFGIKGNQPLSITNTGPCATSCIGTCIPDLTTATNSTISQPAAADSTTMFITLDDIDFCIPLHPKALSHKLFASVGYNWDDCDYPYELLVGGEVEFGQHNSALNQWGILIKLGYSL
jgi:hypothetical protein